MHTTINVKVYSTGGESAELPLKDIKISLKGNLEKLNEIARTFNDSLTVLDEKKREAMRSKKNASMQKILPPILDASTSMALKKQQFPTSRPISAITNKSGEFAGGLYFSKDVVSSIIAELHKHRTEVCDHILRLEAGRQASPGLRIKVGFRIVKLLLE